MRPLRGRGRDWAGLGKRREGEVEGREKEGPKVTVEPGPLRALLRHCKLFMSGEAISSGSYQSSTVQYLYGVNVIDYLDTHFVHV